MQFKMREYTEEDIGGILALFELSFNKKVSKEWLRWKYQGSPWGSKGYVARDNKAVVAFYGGIRLQFIFQGKSLWAYQFCDVMTHPQYRGRIISRTPLIARLGEMFYRENTMDFAYGFPSPRHARLQSLSLGGEGYRLVRSYKKEPLERHPVLWKLSVKEGWDFLGKGALNRLCDPQLRTDWLSNKDTLQLAKNKEYVTWRYFRNPSKTYRLFVFKRMNRIRGAVIFTVDGSRFHVLEIKYEKESAVRDILRALEDYISRNLVFIKSMHMWVHPHEHVVTPLAHLGYNSEDSIPIAFRSVNRDSGVTAETFYDRYFYRMGDYDAS